MGAEFLELDFKEEAGSGDGYAKVMSEAFIKAEMALLPPSQRSRYHCYHRVDSGQTCAEADYPRYGRFYEGWQRDCRPAAQNGGNCEYTVANQVVTTDNGVKVIGYTDLPGRLPTQSSQLYGTNPLTC